MNLTLSDLSPGMVLEAVERCRTLPFESVTGRQADAIALPFDLEHHRVLASFARQHAADARYLFEASLNGDAIELPVSPCDFD